MKIQFLKVAYFELLTLIRIFCIIIFEIKLLKIKDDILQNWNGYAMNNNNL